GLRQPAADGVLRGGADARAAGGGAGPDAAAAGRGVLRGLPAWAEPVPGAEPVRDHVPGRDRPRVPRGAAPATAGAGGLQGTHRAGAEVARGRRRRPEVTILDRLLTVRE